MRPESAGGQFRCEATLERELRARGFCSIAGVDEVGRGSLFGPVVAAAVILSPDRPVRGLNDSKLLEAERREVLSERIRQRAVAWAVAAVDAATIGTWRDNMQVNHEYSRAYFKEHGMTDLVNDVVTRCPTKAIQVMKKGELKTGPQHSVAELDDEMRLVIDNKDCVRCTHCLNVVCGGLRAGPGRAPSATAGPPRSPPGRARTRR